MRFVVISDRTVTEHAKLAGALAAAGKATWESTAVTIYDRHNGAVLFHGKGAKWYATLCA